jgi:hypothetical protein
MGYDGKSISGATYQSRGCCRKIPRGLARIRPVTLGRTITLALLLIATLPAAEVKIAYVGPPMRENSSGKGALLGLDEARLQGQFLGLNYSISPAELTDLAELRGADAILVAGTPGRVLAVAEAVSEQGVPVFNIAATQDALRTACVPNLLHTIPSDAMLATAVAQWKKNSAAGSVSAQAWHPDFVKFAARDLNKRYQASWGADMDDQSWASWAAVRIVADAAANLPDGTTAERLAYIRSELEFDGQKGDYMTFRDTGQLRQLLLVVVDGKLAGEAPVRGVAASDDLDSLDPLVCAAK